MSLYTAHQTKAALNAIVVDSLPGIYEIGRLADCVGHIRALVLLHVGAPTAEQKRPFRDEISRRESDFKEILGHYERTITMAEDRELFAAIPPAFESYRESIHKALQLSEALKSEEAYQAYASESRPRALKLVQAINAEIGFNKENGERNAARATSAAGLSQWSTWVLLLVSILAGGGIAAAVIVGVNRTLRTAVGELNSASQQVGSAARQIATSSQSLAQGASEQAASLEETSASTQEISSMTRQNAEKSTRAAEFMAEAAQRIGDANRNLEQMVISMKEINTSSEKISGIIKVIDEIAFQTNILALNAAVEAARAGEAGMGFAVVADEVRNLAQRCAQAARDTAGLIEESISKSRDGKSRLDQVAHVIQGVTTSSINVKALVEEVNSGSQEQASGIEQMARTITQMEQVTQTTAASAEETASAGEELTAQSEGLREIVTRLKTLVDGHAA